MAGNVSQLVSRTSVIVRSGTEGQGVRLTKTPVRGSHVLMEVGPDTLSGIPKLKISSVVPALDSVTLFETCCLYLLSKKILVKFYKSY